MCAIWYAIDLRKALVLVVEASLYVKKWVATWAVLRVIRNMGSHDRLSRCKFPLKPGIQIALVFKVLPFGEALFLCEPSTRPVEATFVRPRKD
jgi:hypothetical protein